MLIESQTNNNSEVADREQLELKPECPSVRRDPLDLAEILAGFNDNIQRELGVTSVEDRNFGRTIELFNFKQLNGSVCKPAAQKPRKARVSKASTANKDVKEKKPRTPRVRLVKEPKIKAPRKVPVTITGRAILAYAPPTPKGTSVIDADQSITRYLTPTNAIANRLNPTKSTGRLLGRTIDRAGPSGRYRPHLLSPRSARRVFDAQKLLYRETDCVKQSEPSPLGLSSLISLTRGLWQAGNRDQNGQTTDGGPREITSNQEARLVDHSDTLVNLTMLPLRRHSETAAASEAAQLDRESLDSINGMSPSDSGSIIDRFDMVLGTQEYLDQLVAESDDSFELHNLPQNDFAHEVIPTLRSMQSLRESLISTLESDLEERSKETPGKRVFDDTSDRTRNVATKVHKVSSPHNKELPTAKEMDGSKDLSPSSSSAQLTTKPVMSLHGQRELPGIDHANNVIEIETSDESSQKSSEAETRYSVIDPVRDEISAMPRQSADLVSYSVPERPGADTQGQASSALKTSPRKLPSSRKSPQYAPNLSRAQKPIVVDEDDYWVVPDSEDEVVEGPSRPAKIGTSRSEVHHVPNFSGYTTARLQSELGSFGFKVGKNREGMIGLLNQCWAAKMRTGPQATQIRAASTSTATVAPSHDSLDANNSEIGPDRPAAKPTNKKPRETAADKAARLAAEKVFKANKKALLAEEKAAKKLADAEAKKNQKLADKAAADVAKVENIRILYDSLNRLLRSQEGLPWWQRMLKYEPIVLEDFRDWLQDTRSIETDLDTIRDYFDSKGICCVKKITRTGKDRKRF